MPGNVKKRAFLFQGVGSDIGKSLKMFNSEQLNYFKTLCEQASEHLNINLVRYPENKESLGHLQQKFVEWALTGLCDCTVFHSCVESGIVPDYICGYSLGLNNAIFCAGSISLEDSLDILYGVVRCIFEAEKTQDISYDMGIIIGLEAETVNEIIKSSGLNERVMIASENSEYFIVISGYQADVQYVLDCAAGEGALKSFKLGVSFPFHSSILKSCSSPYFKNINDISFNDCKIPIVSIYDQRILTKAEDIHKEQLRNFLEMMHWRTSMEYLEGIGVTDFWDMSATGAMKKSTVLVDCNSSFKTIKTLNKL